MAPTILPKSASGEHIRQLSRTLYSTVSKLSIRDTASTSTPLASVFALILTSRPSISQRALTSLADLPSSSTAILTPRSLEAFTSDPTLIKRQNVILAIPTIYQGLNSGPKPGAVVGIILGSIAGFLLCLLLLLLSLQFYGGRTTVIEKETIIKRKSHSSRRSRRSSHHSAPISVHEPSPPPPPRSRRETIVEIEEEYVHHSSHHASPSPELDEVIVQEEESLTEEIVEVIEEQTQSSVLSPSPPPRKQSSNPRRSGFRVVDPAEFGGGDEPLRRIQSRRSSNNRG